MASRERKRAERRKRKERGAERQAVVADRRAAMAARTEEKNEAAREALEPLAEGESLSPPRGGGVLARIGGEAVSAGQWTPVVDGSSEIVGIATAEPWRSRGLAGLVTAAASRAAFEAGASTCVLSPGNETAQRVYARAGFHRIATMLHYSDPL